MTSETSSAPALPASGDVFRYVAADDPLARPVLDDLTREYDERYGSPGVSAGSDEVGRYPVAEFAPPHGAFVVLQRDDEIVAGGAFKRFAEGIVEFKRIWASPAHRRQGLARRVVGELENEARRRGERGVYLTTGPRQPEAVRLYLATGYTPLFDVTASPETVGIHGFVKALGEEPLDLDELQRLHEADVAAFMAELSARSELPFGPPRTS